MIRRLLRNLFTFCAFMSFLTLIALLILWHRSHVQTDRVTYISAAGHQCIYTRQGHAVLSLLLADWSNQPAHTFGLKYERDEAADPQQDLMTRLELCSSAGITETYWERGSFAWWERRRLGRVEYVMAVAPFWSLASTAGVLPLAWCAMRLRSHLQTRRNQRLGLCSACGYDLRATPDRCPECGWTSGPVAETPRTAVTS